MASQTKLLLIACSGDETAKLTEDISTTLREDYGLEGQVEVLLSQRRAEVDKDTPKAHRHPLVADYFPDAEVQVNIGANELKDVIRGKHVALVEHLLTPCRRVTPEDPQCVSVNDHVSTVRGFLDVISNVETLQRTLVAPYLAYVRSHSVEKYRKKGFFQFDSLRKFRFRIISIRAATDQLLVSIDIRLLSIIRCDDCCASRQTSRKTERSER